MGREIHVRKDQGKDLKFRLYSTNSDCYLTDEINETQLHQELLERETNIFINSILNDSQTTGGIGDFSEMTVQEVFKNYQFMWINESIKNSQEELSERWKRNRNKFPPFTETELVALKKEHKLKREILLKLADLYLENE